MELEKRVNPTKQRDLYSWIFDQKSKPPFDERTDHKTRSYLTENQKPRLAFGFGYDPNIIKKGIVKYTFSHNLENGLKLYEFEPKLSYRIFNILASILKYKCLGSELRDNNTYIKNKYFITDKNPEEVIKKLNFGINEIFKRFKPVSN